MRRAAKVDDSQPAIVEALRKIGARVRFIGQPLDLLVDYRGKTCLMEVKTGKGKLRPSQEKFIADWTGPVHVVRDPGEAIAAVTGGCV